MLGDDDMAVFFNADFCTPWVRLVGAECAPVQFLAILGVQDVEALQGYALGAEYELVYASEAVTLAEGQTLQQVGKPALWRVRQEPRCGQDGRTCSTLIGAAAP